MIPNIVKNWLCKVWILNFDFDEWRLSNSSKVCNLDKERVKFRIMAKTILGGSMLVSGIGLGGVGLVVSEARSVRKNVVTKLQKTLSLPKRCDVYSVVTSNHESGTAKLEDKKFENEVITTEELKEKVKGACDKFNKVYLAKRNHQWVYDDLDQKKRWTVQ
ncbi:hypothetical protein MHC_03120 [Mycoplasma haemocanis str. Illinois]|uniref:Uncharacterized protein n=1 Tax=Mycoplasma haemocanis (strain Illinois) TaxID=1111676 RepID=H6N762_MYCHN|nr:hypothetical protein MHC_03120 [Mycoplasma haemocanis str. Illinois]